MNTRLPTALFIAFFLLATAFGPAPDAHSEEAPQQVLIGVLAKRGVERCLEKWSPTADYLSSRISGKRFVIVPLEYDQIIDPSRLENLDFIICNPSIYVDLEIGYGAMRIATLNNLHAGRSFTRYGGVIFSRQARSDIRSLEDLKGKSFMAVEEDSLGGWHAAWRELAARGIDPFRDFKNFHFAGTHDAVVLAVRDGLTDAGTVRTDTLERMQTENKIDLNDFFIIPVDGVTHENLPFVASTRLYPEWPIAKMGRTSDELGVAVAIALLQITPDDPAAVAGRYAGWTIPLNYQDVHDLLRELKIGPYRDLGKITFADVLKKYWYWLELIAAGFLILAGFTVTIMKLNRRLKASHFRLEAEVGERRLVEKRLIQARDQAEAATRAKSEFLANMSHEIRTPMNGVIAAAELALSEKLPERAAHYLEIIHTSGYSLLGIINDILDFSKIEAEKMALEARPFMLDEILDNVVDVFHNKVAENRIELLGGYRPRCSQGAGGRSPATAADPHQPGQQLRQVHRQRRRDPGGSASGGNHRRAGFSEVFRQGHGHRDRTGVPAAAVSVLQSGRRLLHPQIPGHRPGPGDLQAIGADDGRHHLGGKRAGQGQHVLLHRRLRTLRRPAAAEIRAAGRHPGAQRAGGGRLQRQPRDHAEDAGEFRVCGANRGLGREGPGAPRG